TAGGPSFIVDKAGYAVDDLSGKLRALTALEPLGTPFVPVASPQLAAVLNEGEEIVDATRPHLDRKIVPPVYGRWYAVGSNGRVSLNPARTGERWLEQLNLDPRFRLVAGMGTEFVKQNQEELMAAAWQQYTAIREENQQLNLAAFGQSLANCLHKRLKNIDREDNLLRITSPLHQQNTVIVNQETALSVQQDIAAKDTPNVLYRGAMTRFARKVNGTSALTSLPVIEARTTSDPIPGSAFVWTTLALSDNTQVNITNTANQTNHPLVRALAPQETIARRAANKVVPLRAWAAGQKAGQEGESDESPTPLSLDLADLRPNKWFPQYHAPLYEYLRDLSPEVIVLGL
ncbi:MAG: hypothetical protein AAFN92_22870, partial [Bacteroidota bacterium]